MRIQSLRVRNFRVHDDREIPFGSNITIIVGQNGTGKTTLLEAVYIMLRGRSFRGVDRTMAKSGNDWYKLSCVIDNEYASRQVVYRDNHKEFTIESKTSLRLPVKYKYPVVLFEPDLSRLLTGSPSRRRDYMDNLLGGIDSKYTRNLNRYDKSLKQRNSLLKQTDNIDDIFAWNISLSKYGAYIVERRIWLINQLAERINPIYKAIAQKDDEITVRYSYEASESIQQKLLNDLERNIDRDKLLGTTSVGPHRHDLLVDFNDLPITEAGSRGEVRTVVLSLKFIEVDLIEELLEKQPILLLDDVFGELDKSRQRELVNSFADYQIIITAIEVPKLDDAVNVIKL